MKGIHNAYTICIPARNPKAQVVGSAQCKAETYDDKPTGYGYQPLRLYQPFSYILYLVRQHRKAPCSQAESHTRSYTFQEQVHIDMQERHRTCGQYSSNAIVHVMYAPCAGNNICQHTGDKAWQQRIVPHNAYCQHLQRKDSSRHRRTKHGSKPSRDTGHQQYP